MRGLGNFTIIHQRFEQGYMWVMIERCLIVHHLPLSYHNIYPKLYQATIQICMHRPQQRKTQGNNRKQSFTWGEGEGRGKGAEAGRGCKEHTKSPSQLRTLQYISPYSPEQIHAWATVSNETQAKETTGNKVSFTWEVC